MDQDMSTLAQKIEAASASGDVVDTTLQTSQKVLARVTDGIYRQPASALRELIANAYDADATSVVITTDAPRFDVVSVRDDGNGMSVDTLAHVLENIGGSLKRTRQGAVLKVTDSSTYEKSPGGRKLIGKIGIGLFSVSQLTSHFQIITKVRGDDRRFVADIVLSADLEAEHREATADEQIKTGSVKIWAVPAEDVESQGTEVILRDLRPQTRDILQSRQRWAAINPSPGDRSANWIETDTVVPTFHIGGISFAEKDVIETPARLPWKECDSPEAKFAALVDGVRGETKRYRNPELSIVLDNYFQCVWSLALSLPMKYVGPHPFSTNESSGLKFFSISNSPKGQAADLDVPVGGSVREVLGLSSPVGLEDDQFSIYFDGIKLARPLLFERAVASTNSVRNDLLFVGKCEPDLSSVPAEFRGGRLEFEAYIYWSSKLVPKEHNGVLVRLKGASGTLFDPSFMGYQVSEQTRLRQLSVEIYVSEGLESGLNIDRESFNYSNIHYQYLSRWLHGAIRQFANKHKQISSQALRNRRTRARTEFEDRVRKIVQDVWDSSHVQEGQVMPAVSFVPETELGSALEDEGVLCFSADNVFGSISEVEGANKIAAVYEEKMRAIATILEAYGVIASLPRETQERLLADIAKVLVAEV